MRGFSSKNRTALLAAFILLVGSTVAYAVAATFTSASKMTSNNVFDGFQSIYIDNSDTVHMAFARSPDRNIAMNQIFYRYKPKGGQWSRNFLLTNQSNEIWSRPAILGNGANIYVLSPVKVNNKHQIALFKINGNRTVSKVMITNNNYENISPAMTIRSGIIYIAWLKAGADWKSVVALKKYNTATGAVASERVLTNFTYKSGLQMKGYNDKLHMIWVLDAGGSSAIIYRKTGLNGNMLQQKKVDSAWEGTQTSIDINGGQPYIAYTKYPASVAAAYNIIVARLVDGIWKRTAVTNDAPGIYNDLPDMRVKQGTVYIAYQSTRYNADPSRSEPDIVYASGRLNNLATTRITGSPHISEAMPAIGLDSKLKAHISYRGFDGDDEIYYRRQNN